MAETIWLVGEQGSGKTSLAVALAAQYTRRPGIVCALDMEGMQHRFDPERCDFYAVEDQDGLLAEAQYLFVEVTPVAFKSCLRAKGDRVISLGCVAQQQDGPHEAPVRRVDADPITALAADVRAIRGALESLERMAVRQTAQF